MFTFVRCFLFEQAQRLSDQRHIEQREFADDTEHRLSSSEQAVKKLTQETDRLQSELRNSQETVTSLRGELKENQQQRRALNSDLNEMSDK